MGNGKEMGKKVKILITVKTYPTPSIKYDELVCTAGVMEDGNFIRLYPINYRSKPYWQWYEKYQWVEVEIERRPQDPRPESYRPIGEIKPLGPPIEPSDNWAIRKRFVLAKPLHTMCELQKKTQKEVSLSIIKPGSVEDLIVIEETEREFSREYIARMQQLDIFLQKKRPIEKIPYKFSYRYRCEEPGCKGHTQMITDWELGELYRKMRDKYRDEKFACEKVKEKFYGQICAADRDTHFFVGTILAHGTWIVIGTFWPKREENSKQPELFKIPSL